MPDVPSLQRILVVDDDASIRRVLRLTLEGAGWEVEEAGDAPDALHAIAGGGFDLVVLDVQLPSGSGFEVLETARRVADVPVIMLTGVAAQTDRIHGLELGADDYIAKPFSPQEVAARVRSVLRRTARPAGEAAQPSAAPPPAEVIEAGELRIDLHARIVERRGERVDLTRREYDVFAFLARHPGTAFSREDLLRAVWASSATWQDPATVTEHVRRVRRKVEDDPLDPGYIKTVRGVGYRFDPSGVPDPSA